jgi:hypothetical protein
MTELEKQFLTAVPLTDINESLQVIIESKGSTFESGSDISLLIYNKSTHSIYFDNDSYIKLLVSADQLSWSDVENGIEYFGTTVVSPQGTPLLDFVHTVVRPILDKTDLNAGNQDVILRIVAIGEIMENDTLTGQNAAAYVDVTLGP